MLIVLDTNVLVSALLNPFGKPAAVLGLVLEERITICYDSRILSEYIEVLRRPKFDFPRKEISDLLEFIKVAGLSTVAMEKPVKSTHPQDLFVAQVCLAAKPAYLITGNTTHFPKRISCKSVVTPARFLDEFYA